MTPTQAQETGGPAFPTPDDWNASGELIPGGHGMTLRDYFAANAMHLSFGEACTNIDINLMARYCYSMADAMMEARK
jgi:hypothetical protein